MNYKQLLKSKKLKIAVWGTGYIGLSTMVYFAKKKIRCVGYDIYGSKIKKKVLEKHLKNCKLIIDHDGAWKKYNLKNNYHLSGDHGWI